VSAVRAAFYMASQEWIGGDVQFLGSESLKGLHYSLIPVLVHKSERSTAYRYELQ